VLARGQHGAVARAAHGPAQGRHAPADLHHLALDVHLGAQRGRAQVGRAEGAADAQEGPVARAREQGQRGAGAEVEERGGAAAVW